MWEHIIGHVYILAVEPPTQSGGHGPHRLIKLLIFSHVASQHRSNVQAGIMVLVTPTIYMLLIPETSFVVSRNAVNSLTYSAGNVKQVMNKD